MSEKPNPLSPDWVRCQSKSRPDRYYMFNKRTGETSWWSDTVNIGPQKTVLAKYIMKTPAQDRLKLFQSSMQKKKQSESKSVRANGGRQNKDVVPDQIERAKPHKVEEQNIPDAEKTPEANKEVFTHSSGDGQTLKATTREKSRTLPASLEAIPPSSVQSRLIVTPKKSPFRPTERGISTEPKAKYKAVEYKFVIPKKRVNRPDISSLVSSEGLRTASEPNKSEIKPISPKSPCITERISIQSRINSSSRRLFCNAESANTNKSEIKLPSSTERNKASEEQIPTITEINKSGLTPVDRSPETIQYDINDNERTTLEEEAKPGLMSKLMGFCSKLVNRATKPKKSKHPENKDKDKLANLSLNSKPIFKPKKTDSKSVLRGVLLENESGSNQKQLPSLTHKVSSPITVPNESANARLQRVRNLLQTTTNSTPNTFAISSTMNLISDDSDMRSSICSTSLSTSDCEPMDWQTISEDILDNISSSSMSNVRSADSSNLSEHYDTVNQNLLRLSAEKKQNKQWKTDHFYFVVDTNVFIENIIFVEELTTMKLCDTMGTLIYVPYCVLQELDKLKIRSPSESIKIRSSRAIKYLNKSFEEKHQRIQAQSAADETERLIKVTSPDDSILNCCLQVKQHVDNVLLLTEDINLQNKAMCNDILVSTRSDLISKHESLI